MDINELNKKFNSNVLVTNYEVEPQGQNNLTLSINGEEIICDNFIVSKKLGFKFDKNNKYRVSDDKNSFILYNCISKKTE